MGKPEMLPVISIITIVYNGESFIENTIQSVLSQTYPAIEYVVIDGGSKDKTLSIIQKYNANIKWISERDQGIYDAMNKGLALASGEWINFLNGGDTFYNETTLETIFLDNISNSNFIYGDSINVREGFQKYITPVKLSRHSLKKSMGLCHQAVFVRKAIAPMYDLSYKYKAEYNWVIDIIYKISPETVRYKAVPIVYYSLGGFSEKGMLKNLREFIQTTNRRFGKKQVVLNTFIYIKIFLRYIKYSFAHAL